MKHNFLEHKDTEQEKFGDALMKHFKVESTELPPILALQERYPDQIIAQDTNASTKMEKVLPGNDMDELQHKALIKESTNSLMKFKTKNFPTKKNIIDHWFSNKDIGFIFGDSGSGKTWFALKMALSISNGEDFGFWKCPEPRKVLYLDGEMSQEDMQQRLNLLCPNPSKDNMLISSCEVSLEKGVITDICNPEYQNSLLEYCLEENVKVLFVDNLSCLCYSIRENSSDDWSQILKWILKLRSNGISPILLHHTNRIGDTMRGTSRRENIADWIIKVDKNPNFYDSKLDYELAFTTSFTKIRSKDEYGKKPLDWIASIENNNLTINCKLANTKHIILNLILSGVTSCSHIAQELKITPATVSIHAAKLIKEGLIQKDGAKYLPVI